MLKHAVRGLLALTLGCLLPGCESPGTSGDTVGADAPAGAGGVASITDADFAVEVLQAKTPVLVDFWAPWCGPCRALAPTIQELARDYQGKVKVAKLNTDENQKTAAAHEIQSIPCVILFQDGKAVQRIVGLKPKSTYAQLLDRQLAAR